MTDSAQQPLPDVDEECRRGAVLVDEGKLHEAAEIFRELSSRTDLPDGTRVVMGTNLATVYDKMGHVDTAAQTYEYCVTLAMRNYTWIQERRATFLFEHRRFDEAIAAWEEILGMSFLDAETVQRVEKNLKIAQDARA